MVDGSPEKNFTKKGPKAMYGAVLARLSDADFHRLLLKCDEDLAREVRAQGCLDCRGVLHAAPYPRKPRGISIRLEPEHRQRFSFCCARDGCRHRATPPSLRFLGRRVYLAAVVVLITAMRCGATPARMEKLQKLVGVSRQTVVRWERWWREVLPASPFWRAVCGAFGSPVERSELPASLLQQFAGTLEEQLLALLRFIAPLSGGMRSAKTL